MTGSQSAQDAIRNAVVGDWRGQSRHTFRPDVRVRVWSWLRAVARRVDSRLAPKDHGGERFGQLLSAAGGVTAAPDAVAAAARYDGAQVRAAEEQRDREQQAIIAELRRR